jgi:hypothetical protein
MTLLFSDTAGVGWHFFSPGTAEIEALGMRVRDVGCRDDTSLHGIEEGVILSEAQRDGVIPSRA